ncbi:MAG: hypothetical protein Q8O75_02390 [bacterium]|nr:hypothetical protein [bacterium]
MSRDPKVDGLTAAVQAYDYHNSVESTRRLFRAVRDLGESDDERAVGLLIIVLEKHEDLSGYAADALAKLKTPVAKVALPALREKLDRVQPLVDTGRIYYDSGPTYASIADSIEEAIEVIDSD